MTKFNVSLPVSMQIGARTVDVMCTVTPVDGFGPALMWAEIDGKPAPAPIWDCIEEQLATPGPIQTLYMEALDGAQAAHVAA